MVGVSDVYPTVSILMPVFNESPSFLRLSINSIAAQTFADFEFIILDDGSDKEETIIALNDFAKQDPRIRLYRGPHLGLSKTLNAGLALCRGELIFRQDSDDWSEPNRVAELVDFLKKNPSIGMAGSYVGFHREDGANLWVAKYPRASEEIAEAFYRMNPFCHGAVCFRRKEAEAIGGYREELVCSEDYDFFWRLCDRSGGANLPEVLYHHRFTRRSISAQKSDEQFKAITVAKELAKMRHSGQSEDLQAALKKANGKVVRDEINRAGSLLHADYLILAGYYRQALSAYLRCLLAHPWQLKVWLKLLRWAAFVTLPPMRKRLFYNRARMRNFRAGEGRRTV